MQNYPSSDNYQKTFSSTLFVSRYEVDVYGRPRILSGFEVFLRNLVVSITVATAIGCVLAIVLLVIHDPSILKLRETAAEPPVKSLEAEP
jgi:hypothetical protein